ncbi:MAG: hypothetical protein ACR2KG_03660 [Nocardioidaceae bacterium]
MPAAVSPPVVGLLYPGFGAEADFPDLVHRPQGLVWLPLVHTSVGSCDAGGTTMTTRDSHPDR